MFESVWSKLIGFDKEFLFNSNNVELKVPYLYANTTRQRTHWLSVSGLQIRDIQFNVEFKYIFGINFNLVLNLTKNTNSHLMVRFIFVNVTGHVHKKNYVYVFILLLSTTNYNFNDAILDFEQFYRTTDHTIQTSKLHLISA